MDREPLLATNYIGHKYLNRNWLWILSAIVCLIILFVLCIVALATGSIAGHHNNSTIIFNNKQYLM